MTIVKRSYISVKDIIHQYEYIYLFSEMKHKPKHNCGIRMKYVKKLRSKKTGFDNIGYICEFCNVVYIFNKYKVLRIKEKPIKKSE